jgi:hypothetical protein
MPRRWLPSAKKLTGSRFINGIRVDGILSLKQAQEAARIAQENHIQNVSVNISEGRGSKIPVRVLRNGRIIGHVEQVD